MVMAKVVPSKHFSGQYEVRLPDLDLHCPSDFCGGPRIFGAQNEWRVSPPGEDDSFVRYACRNCGGSWKTFALHISKSAPSGLFEMMKFGEVPAFGQPMAERVLAMLGAERAYFLKGRRAENQGMGIAAFAYYRRVVENKKAEIFEQVIRVARTVEPDPALIADLEAAKRETQFDKAVTAIKHAIPQSLLIDGHNPLKLLHSALSESLHAESDDACLASAEGIRLVLTNLVERVDWLLKDEAGLRAAVARLTHSRKPKGT